LLNVAVFTPFNERGVTVNEFPDRNIALNKTVTSNVLTNSAFYLTDTSTNGAYFEGTNDVSDVRVLIDLGSEFSIGDIMITGILPDPEGGYPPGYNQIIAVELLDTNLEVNWRSADYINGTYDTVDDWSDAWKFAFSVRTPGIQNVTLSELNTTLLDVIPHIDQRITTIETDLETLDESVNALDYRVGANLRSILSITGTGGQIQSLYSIADANSTSITDLETSSAAMGLNIQTLDESVDEIESRVDGLAASFALDSDLDALATAVDGRVTALENAAPTDLGPLDGRVSALENAGDSGTDPALEAHVNAINARVEDNSAAIVSIENKLVVYSGGGNIVDTTSLVVTDSTTWYNAPNQMFDVYNLFDGNSNSRMALKMATSGSTGVAFIELDMGAVVGVGGFIIQPSGAELNRFPRDTRLFSGTSSSGPWTQIGMSIRTASPSNTNEIAVTFPSRSGRYFRVVFTDAPKDAYVDFVQFKFIAIQSIDVLENLNSRITQLETVPDTTDPALEAHVNAIDARVEYNSAAIASMQASVRTSRYVRVLNNGPTLNIVEFAVYEKYNGRENSMDGATQWEPSTNNRANNIA